MDIPALLVSEVHREPLVFPVHQASDNLALQGRLDPLEIQARPARQVLLDCLDLLALLDNQGDSDSEVCSSILLT